MPSSSSTSLFTIVSGAAIYSWLLGLDGNAVIGAFAGAVLMVMTSKDLRWAARLVYLLISWVMGYLAAPELLDHFPIHETGVAAFFSAAVVVVLTLQIIERVRALDLLGWLKNKAGP